MIDSILIGKKLYKILTESTELKKYVNDKIYPLVADNDVTYPFVIYYRTSIKNIINKDGVIEDAVSFTVIVVSNSYIESLEIADIIRRILEKKKLKDNIFNCTLEDVDEDYRENAFIQQLYFSCNIQTN